MDEAVIVRGEERNDDAKSLLLGLHMGRYGSQTERIQKDD